MDDKDFYFSQTKWYSSLFLYSFNFTMLQSSIARKASLITQIYGPILFFQSRPGADPDFLKRGGK